MYKAPQKNGVILSRGLKGNNSLSNQTRAVANHRTLARKVEWWVYKLA